MQPAKKTAEQRSQFISRSRQFDKSKPKTENELISKIMDYMDICNEFRHKTDTMKIVSWMAHFIVDNGHYATLSDTDEIFSLSKETGIYAPYGDAPIRQFVQKICDSGAFPKFSSIHAVNETVAMVRRLTLVDRSKFDSAENIIALGNGILDMKTMRFRKYGSSDMFMSKIAAEYDPTAKCPAIDKFLSETLPGKETLIKEIAGACITRSNPHEKLFMFYGTGSNGKSTVTRILYEMLGKQNISSVSMQHLSEDKFAVADLYNKYANIVPDMSGESLKSTAMLKSLTTGESVRAQRKFGQPFEFINHAKMIWSCNKLPETPDDSDGFFRRIVLVEFSKVFMDGNKDIGLIGKLTSKREISGFLNDSIKAYSEVIKRGYFSCPDTVEAIRRAYTKLSNSAEAFADEMICESEDSRLSKNEIIRAYMQYCRNMHLSELSATSMWLAIQRKYPYESSKITIGGDRISVCIGLAFRDGKTPVPEPGPEPMNRHRALSSGLVYSKSDGELYGFIDDSDVPVEWKNDAWMTADGKLFLSNNNGIGKWIEVKK